MSWAPAELTTGQSASEYYVVRIRAGDGFTVPACGTSPTATTPAVGCSDLGVTDGDYHYTVTATTGNWTAVGDTSNNVSVVNDSMKPLVVVTSITPTPNVNGYNSSSPVVVHLAATDVAGIASITYTIDAEPAAIVSASTAEASVTGDGVHTVTFSAIDRNGQSSDTGSVVVRIDTGAPAAPSAPIMTAGTDSGSSPNDAITNVMTPSFTGTAEPESIVSLYDGATAVGSGTAVGGTYTIMSSLLVSGEHTLTAKATDAASNVGPTSAASTITIDTTAPPAPSAPFLTAASDSGTSSTDRLTNVTTPTLTGTAEDGSAVTLFSGPTAIGSALVTGEAYSVTSSSLAEGAKALTVSATDLAGNVGPASAPTTITVDVTAPGKPGTPVLPAASDTGRSSTDKITSITTPTLTGTATAGTIVTLHDGVTEIGSLTTMTTTYSFAPTLDNGSHVITTKASDAAGNVGPVSSSITVIIDNVAPLALAAPTLSAASDTGKSTTDKITKTIQPVITGINESRAIVVLYEGPTQLGTITTTATTYSITSSPLPAGDHTLTATPTDVAGNLGPTSPSTTITIDTSAPAAPSTPELSAASDTGLSNTDGITKATKPTLTGTAEVGATVGLFDGATATGTAVTATGGTYTAITATLTNATHLIAARATDVAGNVSPNSSFTTVTVDTVLPIVTMNQAAGQADPTSDPAAEYTVTFSETVIGFTNTDITQTGTAGANTTVLSGAGPTYTATISGMIRTGTVIPAIAASIAQDTAGNLNSVATYTDRTVSYVDVTAPAPPSTPNLSVASDTGASSTDRITKTTTPIFTGTAEVGSTVKLFDGATQVGSVVATASGTYSITSTALTNGTHEISATATDGALNLSAASNSVSVTIDTVLPTVTMNQAAGQADPTSGPAVDYTVTFSETVSGFSNTDITHGGTAGANTTVISGPGPIYTVTISGMTKTGTVIPAIAASIAQDTAGNLNSIATYTDRTVTYTDTTAPAVSISTFAAADDTSRTATINGTASRGFGDNLTVTVVLCTTNVYPCAAGNIAATLGGVPVNASSGAWTVTSAALGDVPALYARATQTDLTSNIGTSTVAGPITILI